MRICNVEHCSRVHEARGYCKKHYKIFLKYGDALHVEQVKMQRESDRQKQLGERQSIVKKEKICSVKDCGEKSYARQHCQKHYSRLKRKGTLYVEKKRNIVQTDICLVIGCANIHVRHGFCKSHLGYINKMNTPYRAKTKKYCGIEQCEELHYGKGLCKRHYHEWYYLVKQFNLKVENNESE